MVTTGTRLSYVVLFGTVVARVDWNDTNKRGRCRRSLFPFFSVELHTYSCFQRASWRAWYACLPANACLIIIAVINNSTSRSYPSPAQLVQVDGRMGWVEGAWQGRTRERAR